jgi:chromate transporter
MLYLLLYLQFFKVGLFSVGGGLATLPFLYEMSANTGWFTSSDIANMVAISESTPGPMGVNMAVYVGFITTSNGLGAVIATLGLITPSIIIILIIVQVLAKFKESTIVNNIFYGLRPASVALIAIAAYKVAQLALFHNVQFSTSLEGIINIINWKALILAVILFAVIRKRKIHPVVFIVISAMVGIIFQMGN